MTQQTKSGVAARMAALKALLDGESPEVEEIERLEADLGAAASRIHALEEELAGAKKLLETAQTPVAILHGVAGGRAEVSIRGQHACLAVAPELARTLPVGHRVELNADRTAIVRALGPFKGGAIGEVRFVENGVLHLEDRGTTLVVERATELAAVEVRSGDRVRYDEESRLAYQLVQRHEGGGPARPLARVERTDIAGYEKLLRRIERAMDLAVDPAVRSLAEAYRLGRRRVFCFEGPPGTGKSLLMKYAATYAMGRLAIAPEAASEVVVVVEDLLDKWVGVPNQRLRRCLDAAGRACERHGLGVLLVDDADRFFGNRARKSVSHQVGEELAMDFSAWLDGLRQREEGCLLVALSTNHLENLDAALWRGGRAEIVPVGVPDRRTREAILEVHLRDRALCSPGGAAALSRAVSDYLSGPDFAQLVEVRLADGKRLALGVRDLVVGADLAAIVERASEEAFAADLESAGAGAPAAGLALETLRDVARDYLVERARHLGEGVRRIVAELRDVQIREIRALV